MHGDCNIKMSLKEGGCNGMDWISLAKEGSDGRYSTCDHHTENSGYVMVVWD